MSCALTCAHASFRFPPGSCRIVLSGAGQGLEVRSATLLKSKRAGYRRSVRFSIVALLHSPDRRALAESLSDSVRFHSPVSDYEGRDDVAHLLSLIATVLEDLRPTRELGTSASRTTFLEATVDDQPIQGVLDERHDASGRLLEATLMLRPLSALRRAVAAMAQALDDEPLPSRAVEVRNRARRAGVR